MFTTFIASLMLGATIVQASCPFSDKWEPAGPEDGMKPKKKRTLMAKYAI